MAANDNSNVHLLANFENNALLSLQQVMNDIRENKISSLVIGATMTESPGVYSSILMSNATQIYTLIGIVSAIEKTLIDGAASPLHIGWPNGEITEA